MERTLTAVTYCACSEVSDATTFLAARAGFNDYIMPFSMTQDEFVSRFWGPEGNSRKISYVALHENIPIGLVLSGIRRVDGLKTMRCGMLGVAPEFRGTEVAEILMNLHIKVAALYNCERLFLEVINGNDRAISFYHKMGYFKAYDIKYFSFAKDNIQPLFSTDESLVKECSIEQMRQFRESLPDIHIHWQREFESMKFSTNKFYTIECGGQTAGGIAYNDKVISFLYVLPAFRNRGLGRSLLTLALQELSDNGRIVLSFTNNVSLEFFCLANNGKQDEINQFEMYKTADKLSDLL